MSAVGFARFHFCIFLETTAAAAALIAALGDILAN